ncbi:MAG: YqaA family protein [Candidatus Woesearchaeota archaeon]
MPKKIKKVLIKSKKILDKTFDKTKTKIKNTHTALKQRVGLGFWIFIVIVFLLGIMYFTVLEQSVNYLVEKYGILGMFFGSFILDLLVQPIGPDLILIFGVFAGINPYIVLISSVLGSYLSLLTAYYIGKKIGGAGIEKIVGKKTYEKIEKSPNYGKWILFFGSISPIPYVPYLAGMWKLSFKEVLIIVLIPRTIRFTIVWGFAYFLNTNLMDFI